MRFSELKGALILCMALLFAVVVFLSFFEKESQKAVEETAYNGAKTLAASINLARVHYSTSVASRLRDNESTPVSMNYREYPYGVPNPATFAIELGQLLSDKLSNTHVKMYSNYPFLNSNKRPHTISPFERKALAEFEKMNRLGKPLEPISEAKIQAEKMIFHYAEPIMMEAACVACHNSLAHSPKTDWKVGDVRGALSVTQNIMAGESLKRLLNMGFVGIVLVAVLGVAGLIMTTYYMHQKLADKTITFRKIANTDSLTKLLNRRGFDEALDHYWRSNQKSRSPLSLIYCDIDNFKDINDIYGHSVGDDCLKSVASILYSQQRSSNDVAARWGGDEIAILLDGANSTEATSIAERFRASVKALDTGGPVLTISVGVVTMIPEATVAAAQFLGYADDALYQAKREGRDRVVVMQ